jgi:EAL domain-containing protein (putative c-di-GMP-specific phosphodiesterase class I)
MLSQKALKPGNSLNICARLNAMNQGYLIGRPMPADQACGLLDAAEEKPAHAA